MMSTLTETTTEKQQGKAPQQQPSKIIAFSIKLPTETATEQQPNKLITFLRGTPTTTTATTMLLISFLMRSVTETTETVERCH